MSVKLKQLDHYVDSSGNSIVSKSAVTPALIRFAGSNNTLIVDGPCKLENLSVKFVGDNGTCIIGDDCRLINTTIRLGSDCRCQLGRHVTVTDKLSIDVGEKTTVSVGDDCMFAMNVELRTGDSHAIYDVVSMKRVNPSKDITLGEHVWIGIGTTVTKGVTIGFGSVVGRNSLVTKSVPNNSLAVGCPAKVIRDNIAWERTHLITGESKIRNFVSAKKRRKYWFMTASQEQDILISPPARGTLFDYLTRLFSVK